LALFQKVLLLCQDTDQDIRLDMCKQLAVIAKDIASTEYFTLIMEEFKELLKDEELDVRAAAVTHFFGLSDKFDDGNTCRSFIRIDMKGEYVIGLWKGLTENIDPELEPVIADVFGLLVYHFRGWLSFILLMIRTNQR
jgi:hypothetical protein